MASKDCQIGFLLPLRSHLLQFSITLQPQVLLSRIYQAFALANPSAWDAFPPPDFYDLLPPSPLSSLCSNDTFLVRLSLPTPFKISIFPPTLITLWHSAYYLHIYIWSPSPHPTKKYSEFVFVFTICSLLQPQYLDCLAHNNQWTFAEWKSSDLIKGRSNWGKQTCTEQVRVRLMLQIRVGLMVNHERKKYLQIKIFSSLRKKGG